VFRVGGNIVNHSRLQVSNPYLTIAGQTAPGGGITIGGASMQGEALFINTARRDRAYITCQWIQSEHAYGPRYGNGVLWRRPAALTTSFGPRLFAVVGQQGISFPIRTTLRT